MASCAVITLPKGNKYNINSVVPGKNPGQLTTMSSSLCIEILLGLNAGQR